jgi:hypothetical protein
LGSEGGSGVGVGMGGMGGRRGWRMSKLRGRGSSSTSARYFGADTQKDYGQINEETLWGRCHGQADHVKK